MSVSIVWLDPFLAKIFHFSDDRMERMVIPLEFGNPSGFDLIVSHLANSKQVVVLSPGNSGPDLIAWVKSNFPDVSRRIVGCETLPTADNVAIAEYAVRFFRKPVKPVKASG